MLFIRQYLRTCLHLEKGKDEAERVNANPMGLLLYSTHWDGTMKERGIRRSQTGCHVDHVGLELVAFLGKFISGVYVTLFMEFNYGIFSTLAYWSQNRGRGNALFGERRDELPSHEQVHTFMPCVEERDMSGAIQ